MATEFKEVSSQKRKMDRLLTGGFGLLALLVYGLTVSKGVYPGESAHLMAVYSGLEPLELPMRPIWGMIVSWLSGLSFLSLPFRLNLFSAVCMAISAGLFYRLMSFMIHEFIQDEDSLEHAPNVSVWAGAVTALAFIFAMPVWQAATRLQLQSFDILLVLTAASLLLAYADTKRTLFLAPFALLYGMGIVESIIFIPLLPVFIFFLVVVLWKHEALTLKCASWIGLLLIAGLGLYWLAAKSFFATHDTEALGFATVSDVMIEVWKTQIKELMSSLPRFNWLTLLLMSVVPWLAGGFASVRALNNERSWSLYILHIALTVVTVLGLLNATVSPWAILKPLGQLPVWTSAMLAMTTGYLVAYWLLLLKVDRVRHKHLISHVTKQTGDWLGLLLSYPLIAVVLVAAVINTLDRRNLNGDFADRCAQEILDRMNGRTWFVTDGTLDAHLQIMAHERGQELNLLCLQKDMNPAYLKGMAEQLEEKKLFAPEEMQRMKNTLALGVLPFIQDWFAQDKEIEKTVAVFGMPDFWYTAGMIPVPEFFFFSGCRDISVFNDKPLFAEYSAFWKEMDTVLAPNKDGSTDPLLRFRAHLRRHMGFVANNLGVLLEDLKKEENAFAAYTYVYTVIDPENISSMFNRFEMARQNVSAAMASKEAIERDLKEFIKNLKRQYPLWSLSRYYGYVRSPEIFAKLGWGWALSGQTGAALAGIKRALDLLPSEKQTDAMQSMAALYSLADDKAKTEAIYQDILKNDPENRSALLGLTRLAMRENAMDKAKGWLEQASKLDDKRGALGVEWAAIHLMNSDLDQARITLQETTDLQPKNLQAWSMLAMLNLQQDQISEIETVILPKMEKLAGTSDDYFIQITRAQLYMKKGKDFMPQAREAFLRASILRPDIPAVKDTVLQLDIAMNDQKSAELHARQVLRVDRDHALANYILGSLRLQEGAYGEAEDFLRRSAEANPSAATLNDLAEVLRRIRKFDEAEERARAALKLNSKLDIAWETLASILFDADKDLNEAEQAISKYMAVNEENYRAAQIEPQIDPRVQITLARIQLKKGEIERARDTIRLVKAREKDLTPYDKEALAKLSEAASAKK